MTKALTNRSVEATRPGKARREIPDGLLRGLYLVLQVSGAKSWAVRYRYDTQTRKHTLGPYPRIDLKAARELGGAALRAAAEGRDPAQEKKQASKAARPATIEAAVRQFLDTHCKRNQRRSTQKETERLLRLYVLSRWASRAVGSVTRDDIHEMADRIVADDKPILANRAFAKTRKFFNWCVEHRLIAASPCAGMRRPVKKEKSRDRVLSDAELRAVWGAAGRINGPFGSVLKLLILTGQRRSEVAEMEWPELDLEQRLWTLPPERVKNDTRNDVPLSPPAVAVIEQVKRIGERFVFTLNGEAPIADFSKGKDRLDALLPPDMPAWTLHDLRRSVASGMARLGISLPVIEKVLNHRSGSFAGIVGIYQRHDFRNEKAQALERWGSHVEHLVSHTSAKVTALHGQR